MLNFYNPWRINLREEAKLKYWQFVLRLTRLAASVHQCGRLFYQNRLLMALAFLSGVLIGLLPALKLFGIH